MRALQWRRVGEPVRNVADDWVKARHDVTRLVLEARPESLDRCPLVGTTTVLGAAG